MNFVRGFLITIGVVAGVAVATPLVASVGVASDENRPLRVTRTVLPVFPRSLLSEGVTEGWARVVIAVDAAGALEDWLLVGHSEVRFGEAAVDALKEWEFLPLTVNGRTVASQAAVAFRYEALGVVVDITPGFALTKTWFRNLPGRIYRPRTLSELDSIPVPEELIEPGFPQSLADRGISGSATVEFYIDEQGTVRMPAIVRADFPELGHLLANAVRQWKFAPPTASGRPVLVHASQTVTFDPQKTPPSP